MSATLLVHTVQQGAGSGNTTTGAIDTTGATLLVVAIATQAISAGSLTDSKSNTWKRMAVSNAANTMLQFWYSVPTSVGSGHTFTSTNPFSAIAVQAWSGVSGQNWNGGTANSGTTVASGSLSTSQGPTPALYISGFATLGDGTYSINSSFTISDQVTHLASNSYGVGIAYKISSGPENTTWTWPSSGSNEGVTGITAFPITGSSSGGGGSFGFA